LVWKSGGITRNLVAVDLIIAIVVLLSVLTLFRPINIYFESMQYEPTKLKSLVDTWLLYNKIRLAIIFIGLIISLWALNSYQAVTK
jgi:hypothetical protein